MSSDLPDILTLDQAAQYLQLSIEELEIALSQGEVPGKKIGSKWRLSRSAINNYLGYFPKDSSGNPSEKNEPDTPNTTYIEPIADGSVQSKDNNDNTNYREESSISVEKELPPVENGKVRGRVFAYNMKGGFGYARLADNRVVWLDSNQLLEKRFTPFPGDIFFFFFFF